MLFEVQIGCHTKTHIRFYSPNDRMHEIENPPDIASYVCNGFVVMSGWKLLCCDLFYYKLGTFLCAFIYDIMYSG